MPQALSPIAKSAGMNYVALASRPTRQAPQTSGDQTPAFEPDRAHGSCAAPRKAKREIDGLARLADVSTRLRTGPSLLTKPGHQARPLRSPPSQPPNRIEHSAKITTKSELRRKYDSLVPISSACDDSRLLAKSAWLTMTLDLLPWLLHQAGRCERRGETNIVDPLPSKGLLYVEHNEEDGVLNHLCYKDLESGAVIDDFIIFAGDASFQKVLVPDSATARVYALCFSSSNQKLLYWMQDPDSTTDAANVARLNQLIVDDGEMAMEYASAADEIQTAHPAEVEARPEAPTPNGVSVEQMNQLQSIIAGFGQNSASMGQAAFRLGDILTMEVIEPMLKDPEILQSLESYLPPGIKADPASVGRDSGLQTSRQCEGVEGYVDIVLNLKDHPKPISIYSFSDSFPARDQSPLLSIQISTPFSYNRSMFVKGCLDMWLNVQATDKKHTLFLFNSLAYSNQFFTPK
ncbi:hypothetical protein H4Q26_010787 [Puccinia striiformis f. sp. tritici PST-130]|nr:hypothetical protein H4Q26_010787 [Puccinia striiformis f. sp. tritici PST-130]